MMRGYLSGKRTGSRTMCGLLPRAKVVGRTGNKLTYLFPCGHKRTEVMMVGPAGARKPADEGTMRFFERYWGEGQGVSYQCPKCLREERKAAKKKGVGDG